MTKVGRGGMSKEQYINIYKYKLYIRNRIYKVREDKAASCREVS